MPHVPGGSGLRCRKRAFSRPCAASLKKRQVPVCTPLLKPAASSTLHNDKDLKLGAPYIKGASVDARVLKQGKGKKITVFTYRPKKGSSRKMGHRQPYTKVQIEQIRARAPRAAKTEAAAEAEAEA